MLYGALVVSDFMDMLRRLINCVLLSLSTLSLKWLIMCRLDKKLFTHLFPPPHYFPVCPDPFLKPVPST